MVRTGDLHGRHRPIILGDAGPEHPEHDDGQEGEEGLEEGAVDPAVGRVAEMRADDILKDLTNRKQESRSNEVYWTWSARIAF